MPLPATIEICQKDLFTAEDELKRKYDEITVRRLLRLREMYAWAVANPDAKDRQFVEVLVPGIAFLRPRPIPISPSLSR